MDRNGQYRAKIADFGLSKSKDLVTHSTSRNASGTITHQAPEILWPPEGATERFYFNNLNNPEEIKKDFSKILDINRRKHPKYSKIEMKSFNKLN